MNPGRRISYSNVTSTLALLLAVTGGAAYAADKIGSKEIKKDAVKAKHIKAGHVRGDEIADGSVGEADVASAVGEPRAFARVLSPTGNPDLIDESRSKGVAAGDVTHPAEGTYCFDLDFEPRTIHAVSDTSATRDQFVQASIDRMSSEGCESTDDAIVRIFDVSTVAEIDASAYVQFD